MDMSQLKKDFRISELNDLYGSLLTKHQSDALRSYYDYDFSLSEIAENIGVSRQAVHDTIAKAEEQLAVLEDKLGLLRKNECMRKSAEIALDELCGGNIEFVKDFLKRIIDNRF